MRTLSEKFPFRLAATYCAVATAWIIGTDAIVALSQGASREDWLLNSAKGLLFVAVTTALVYELSRRHLRQILAAQEKLAESNLRLRLALEASGDGSWDWNIATGECLFSPRVQTLLGYAENAFQPDFKEWQDRIHPDDAPETFTVLAAHFEGKAETFTHEYRVRAADGIYRWVLSRGRVVSRTPDGKPLRMLGLVSDLTGSLQSKERLAEALAFSGAVLRAAPVGIVAYAEDGQTIVANEAAAAAAGGTVQEILRQNFRQIEGWRTHGLLAKAEEALRTKANVPFRMQYVSSFGRPVMLDGVFAPFHFQGSARLLMVFSDITEQHRTQELLNLLQSAILATDNGWVVTDVAGRIIWVNPAFTRLTGYSSEEVIGQNPKILRSGRHPSEFYAQLWGTIQRGEIWTGEVENKRKDGTFYTQGMTIVPVRNADRKIINFVAITQNVTRQKELESQLQHTQRMESIGMLASGIAHDLNNILTPIMMSVELLKLDFPTPEGKRRIEVIEAATKRGAGIVRQVLTFARGQGGERIEIEPKQLIRDLNHLLEETIPREITIRMRVMPEVHQVSGDPTQLHQVLLNLAVNARDAMPQGGTLTLGAENVMVDPARCQAHPSLKPGPHVAFTVTDTGTGIPPEVMDHMFEPFFTTKVRGKGTGLGLSTVYGLVRSHGGAVEVRSTVGQGAEFTVLLPAVMPVPAEAPEPAGIASVSGHQRCVLVVDDEESIRYFVATVLELHGFTVVSAVDGQDAWEKFRREPRRYSALITDMMMPRRNGAALVAEIRETGSTIPIIACSGLVDSDTESDPEALLLRRQVGAVLRKPFTEHQLMRALEQTMNPDAKA